MKVLNLGLIAATAVILFGCGRETLQDNLSREIDRSTETSTLLGKRYQAVAGEYITDDTQDTSPFWVDLTVQNDVIQKDGFLTPQPALTGILRTWRKESNATLTLAMSGTVDLVSFPFNNGAYDQGQNQLTFKIPGTNTDGTPVTCKVKDTLVTCKSLPSAGNSEAFNFILVRLAESNTAAKAGK